MDGVNIQNLNLAGDSYIASEQPRSRDIYFVGNNMIKSKQPYISVRERGQGHICLLYFA